MNRVKTANGVPTRRFAAAFTLIELLVVVAVIAILAAMLLPALAKAKQSAWRIHCVNSVRQLAVATQLYWQDHDNQAFRWRQGRVDGGDLYWFGWITRGAEGTRTFDLTRATLWPYLESRGIELCPSFDYGYSRLKLKATSSSYGFGYNLHLSRPLSQPPLKVDSIARPSEIVLFADSAQVNTFQAPASPSHPMLEEFYYVNENDRTVHFRHREQANIAFMDGRVDTEPLPPDTLDHRLPNACIGRLDARMLNPSRR